MRRFGLGMVSVALLFTAGCAEKPSAVPVEKPSATAVSAVPNLAPPTVNPEVSPSSAVTRLTDDVRPEPSGTPIEASPGSKPPLPNQPSGSPSSAGRKPLLRLQEVPGIRNLQTSTGLKIGALLRVHLPIEKSTEGQVCFFDGSDVFYVMHATANTDEGVSEAIARLRSIDETAAEPKFESKTRNGVTVKSAEGVLRKGDGMQRWVLYLCDGGGKKALSILVFQKAGGSATAQPLIDSLSKSQ